MSLKSTCPRDPVIDRLDTKPDSLSITSINQAVAIRRSGRSAKAPDILTYTDTPTIKRNKAKVNELKIAIEKTGKSKKAKMATVKPSASVKPSATVKPIRDPKSKANSWAIHRAWLNKLRLKRQEPEYIKQQQSIVAKHRHTYIPYKWRPELSTYENLYRSELLKKSNHQGSSTHSHRDIIAAINLHIKRSLPMTTTPLSLSISPERLRVLKQEESRGSMTPEQAISIIENVDTASYIKVMQALRTIENMPSDAAVATSMSATPSKSIPIVKPTYAIPKDINGRIMKNIERELEEKYGDGFDITTLADPKYSNQLRADPACDADVVSDAILTDLQTDIITDVDLENFNREILSKVMNMHGITNPQDPRLKSLIDNYMRSLPELADSDFESAEASTFVTDNDDIITEIDRKMQDLSLDSSKSSLSLSPSKKTLGKRKLGEGIRRKQKTRTGMGKVLKKLTSKNSGKRGGKRRSYRKKWKKGYRQQRGGVVTYHYNSPSCGGSTLATWPNGNSECMAPPGR